MSPLEPLRPIDPVAPAKEGIYRDGCCMHNDSRKDCFGVTRKYYKHHKKVHLCRPWSRSDPLIRWLLQRKAVMRMHAVSKKVHKAHVKAAQGRWDW